VNVVDQLLHDHYDEFDLESLGLGRRWSTVLLTPRFVTSRHIVALVYRNAQRHPTLVAKVPRRPGDNEGVRREAQVLHDLARHGEGRVSGVPVVVGTPQVGAHTVLIETALNGAPLDPDRVAKNLPTAVKAGARFVGRLPVTRAAKDNDGWYARTIAVPLEELTELAPLGGQVADLVRRTHDLLAPLRSVALPAVFEHADLSHPNLFLPGNGELQVVDWERASADGLPGHDLIFYLQYLGESVAGAFTRDRQVSAFDQAFGPGGWTRGVVREHLQRRGVDPDLLPLLILVTWARSTGTLVARLTPSDLTNPVSGERQRSLALSEDRDFWLWRHVVSAASQYGLG